MTTIVNPAWTGDGWTLYHVFEYDIGIVTIDEFVLKLPHWNSYNPNVIRCAYTPSAPELFRYVII